MSGTVSIQIFNKILIKYLNNCRKRMILNCMELLKINKCDLLYSKVFKTLGLDVRHPLTYNRHRYKICIPYTHRRVQDHFFFPTTNPCAIFAKKHMEIACKKDTTLWFLHHLYF